MKKLGLILFAFLLVTSFGCNNIKGSQEEANININDGKDNTVEQSSESTAEPEYPISN